LLFFRGVDDIPLRTLGNEHAFPLSGAERAVCGLEGFSAFQYSDEQVVVHGQCADPILPGSNNSGAVLKFHARDDATTKAKNKDGVVEVL
jgi:hypothetical protein